jgi:hypothetical protein
LGILNKCVIKKVAGSPEQNVKKSDPQQYINMKKGRERGKYR